MRRICSLFFLMLLCAAPAWAASTYYVAKTGNDSFTCSQAQSTSTPRRTVNAGLSCLASTDTLQIREGSYSEAIDNLSLGSNVPSGGGSFGTATKIMAYPSETVWLAPSGVNHVIEISNRSYVIIDGIKVDMAGTNPASNPSSVGVKLSSGANHVRYTNGEIKNGGNGVQIADEGSDYNEITHSNLHDLTGPFSPPFTGLYIGENFNLVEYNTVSNVVGECWQAYSTRHSPTGNVIRNNVFDGCNNQADGSGSGGIMSGTNTKAYNNIFKNTHGASFGAGLSVFGGCVGCVVYGNTIYNNHWYAIQVDAGVVSVTIKGNILFGNGTNDINDLCGCVVQSNNLKGTNPLFINAPGGDFHLNTGSPAIGAGADLSSVFTTDFYGTTRTLPWDIGAVAFGGTPTPGVSVTAPVLGSVQYRPAAVSIGWSQTVGSGTATIDYSSTGCSGPNWNTIASGLAYNSSPYSYVNPTWPASATTGVRVTIGAYTDCTLINVQGQYAK